MNKGADAFRSIGEVAKLIGVAPHVLRYWETQFTLLRPMKRPDGRRYYRPDDLRLAAGLCEVLREDGLTIRGAKKLMAQDRGEAVRQRGAERLRMLEPAPQAQTDSQGQIGSTERITRHGAAPDAPDAVIRNGAEIAAPDQPLGQPSEPAEPPELPLQQEPSRDDDGANWLARLVSTAAILRRITADDPRLPAARTTISALSQNIGANYY